MARTPVTPGRRVGITGEQTLHAFSEIRTSGAREKMKMVGREHKRRQFPSATDHGIFKILQQLPSIGIISKDGLPRVATRHHMRDCTGYSMRSGRAMIAIHITYKQKTRADPLPCTPAGLGGAHDSALQQRPQRDHPPAPTQLVWVEPVILHYSSVLNATILRPPPSWSGWSQ